MTDHVFIEGLEIEALIGIYDWERRIRQTLVFDIEMRTDTRIAALSDQLADALDYHAVSMRLVEFAGESSFQLVETLAERCAAIFLYGFGVARVLLKLRTRRAAGVEGAVGVVIERSRA